MGREDAIGAQVASAHGPKDNQHGIAVAILALGAKVEETITR